MLSSSLQTIRPGDGLLRELADSSSQEQMQICQKDYDIDVRTINDGPNGEHLARYRLKYNLLVNTLLLVCLYKLCGG